MTRQSQLRRLGWIAVLAICTALYGALHLKVHTVKTNVVAAEKRIIALERNNLLLETEFAARANVQQLVRWNRLEFGYRPPEAGHYIENERSLAAFGTPRADGAPMPIRVAGAATGENAPEFPRLVSPLTGRVLDDDLVDPAAEAESRRAARADNGMFRIPLADVGGGSTTGSAASVEARP
ncbi:hypothetical protein [Paraurantiacibacter namhicola]|uniref:Uncharacterized protein n=1 Tax=Paraurantiacibacter namhicola TaxID=645517 RepID=A0A1C7DB54_9SPHN|nr:hypothetical protein [Paraurantiacibacter namhicola]ANU08551.1 hypothetical protein A6F65_02268 [Paraurantiacibacter namhicola]